MNYKILKSRLTAEDMKYYEDVNPGYLVKTSDCMLVNFEDGSSSTYVIFEGSWTRSGMCRDCGIYFEIAIGSEIKKIYK